MTTRAEKLVALRDFADLQTGKLNESAFTYENTLYDKAVALRSLNRRIAKCDLCEELNIKRFTDSAPAWGDPNARVFFIGQSLHKPGIISGLPFILGSGYLLDAALRLSGLLRKDVFITNTVHCHPPGNRASEDTEKQNCLMYLAEEISIVKPKLIVALGNDAKWAVNALAIKSSKECRLLCVKHPASFSYVAPERRVEWVLKLSKEIDKVYKVPLASKTHREDV